MPAQDNLPQLPDELIGKILGKTGLFYSRRFQEVATSPGLSEYTEMAQKDEEASWEPVVTWIKSTLQQVKTMTIRENNGTPNSYQPDGADLVPDRLLACWSHCWYYDDANVDDMQPFILTEAISAEIADGNDYSLQTNTRDQIELVLFYPGPLPPGVHSVEVKLTECKFNMNRYADEEIDTHTRTLQIIVRPSSEGFVMDHFRIEILSEEDKYPGSFHLGVWGKKNSSRTAFLPAYSQQILLLLRGLLTMEGPPYLRMTCWNHDVRGLLREHKFHLLGIQGLH